MQRTTPMDISFRSFVGGGARGCIHKADDTKLMQEVKASFMLGETFDKIEHPQNYGFTANVREADYDSGGGGAGGDGSGGGGGAGGNGQKQEISKSAEHFSQFMGGNRALAVCSILDDRRYRLKNLQEGESTQYDDQQQKVHIQRDRIYVRSEYKVEMRVIKDQQYMDGHGKDQSASRDQQLDKSRRWSTLVMDKDTITIERTNIVNDDDSDDKNKHTQDEPEQHIVMLSRVFLDAMHIHIFTPTISILWDEEKKNLILNTGRNKIILDDIEQYLIINTAKSTIAMEDKEDRIQSSTTKKNIMQTPSTAVFCDEDAKVVHVGELGASIPAAMLGSIDTNGDKIIAKVAKKVLVI